MTEEITEDIIETIPAAPAVEEEKTHVYQPTDAEGRPMGGKQVLKYRTHEELIEKIQEQNILLLRKLREETRKNRLGIVDTDDAPQDARQLRNPIEFNPRQLTPDERVALSRDLLDPDRFEQATDMMFEATVGAKPSDMRTVLSDLQDNIIRLSARAESDAFMAANPGYVRCPENSQAITNWMVRYNLEPVKENFQRAFDTLKAAGILIERAEDIAQPQSEPVKPPVQTEQVIEPVKPQVEPVNHQEPQATTPVARISSGMTRDLSSNIGTPVELGSDIVYEAGGRRFTGLAAVNAMPSDEYRKRLRDPAFTATVEKLEAAKKRK